VFGIFKNKVKEQAIKSEFIVVKLNARIQPMHRGEIFGDPLNEILEKKAKGEVSGGGTMQSKSGEIEYCDIEIEVKSADEATVNLIRQTIENIGAPKGSKIQIEESGLEIEFGTLEGLAIYLNGTDLEEEVYKNSDSNHVYSELDRLTKGVGKVYSYWQGQTETAFYLYGLSFAEMKSKIAELVESYPLCQKCRIEQIA